MIFRETVWVLCCYFLGKERISDLYPHTSRHISLRDHRAWAGYLQKEQWLQLEPTKVVLLLFSAMGKVVVC